MDIAKGVCVKLKQILTKFKQIKIIRSYTCKVDFDKVDEDDRECLMQVDDLLGKCIDKINSRPKRAEIRNVIGELMRKKNIEQNLFYDSQDENATDVANNETNKGSSRHDLKSPNDYLPRSSKEKLFLCEFCGRRFLHCSRMMSHISKVHSGENLELSENVELNKDVDVVKPTVEVGTVVNLECENNHQRCESCRKAKLFSQELYSNEEPCPYHKQSFAREVQNICHEIAKECAILQTNDVEDQEKTQVEEYKCLSCPLCHRSFRLEQSLGKHIRLKHSNRIDMNFPCTKCEKNFSEKGKLNRHLLIHEGEQYQCLECSKSFHRMDNLRRHFSLIHEQLKSYECRYCHKGFSLKFNRDVHERNIHEIGEEIECGLCGKRCKNRTTFNEHKKMHEKIPVPCPLCPKKFLRKQQYRNHLKNKHKGISPFQRLFDSFAMSAEDSSA